MDFGDLWSLPPIDDGDEAAPTSTSSSSSKKKVPTRLRPPVNDRAPPTVGACTQAYSSAGGKDSDSEMIDVATSSPPGYRLRWVSKVSQSVAFDKVVGLSGKEVRVGRQREQADLFIDSSRADRMISRVHAKLTCENPGKHGERWTVADNGSVNGVYVNGRRIGKARGFGKAVLTPGDTVQFGAGPSSTSEFVFRFEVVPSNSSPDEDFDDDSSTDEEGGSAPAAAAARSHRQDMSDDHATSPGVDGSSRRKRTRSLSLDDSDYGVDSQSSSEKPRKVARTSSPRDVTTTGDNGRDSQMGDDADAGISGSGSSMLEIERLKKEAEIERLRLQMKIAELERDKLKLENERLQSSQSQSHPRSDRNSPSMPPPSSSSSSSSLSSRTISKAPSDGVSDADEKVAEPWTCDVCTMENSTHHKECSTCGYWSCTVCFFKRNTPDANECVRCTIEKPDPKLKCKYCGEKMRELELQDHLLAHEHERVAKEKRDSKRSEAKSSALGSPVLLTRTRSAIPCEVCQKEFSFMEYEGHLRSHRKPVAAPARDSVSEASIPCDVCGEKFPLACYQDHFEEHKEQRKLKAAKDTIPVNSNVGMACKIIEILRAIPEDITGGGSCVNYDLSIAFVDCYRAMVKKRGFALAKPQIVYHWTNEKNFQLIEENNLKVPDGLSIAHATDDGFYGRGIYTSPSATYATGYGHGAKKTFACLAVIGKEYKASYPKDRGKSLRKGFDMHVSSDRGQMEWVFFDSAQLLPCFLAEPRHMEELKIILDELGGFLEKCEKDRHAAEARS